MAQLLLFPDPRPLVERLGPDFFRSIPNLPGVYLMRDARDTIVYVGKAKNLRKRLASYRVANPERLRSRHLKLLHCVERIELQTCGSESAALAKESELLRNLRPRFNRAGTWVGSRKFVGWRLCEKSLELAVLPRTDEGWKVYGPLGHSAYVLRAALARLVWQAMQPEHSWSDVPPGWFGAPQHGSLCVAAPAGRPEEAANGARYLEKLFAGEIEQFTDWILQGTLQSAHAFQIAVRDKDLDTVKDLVRARTRFLEEEFA